MKTNRTKLGAGLAALVSSGLLLVTVPTGTSQAVAHWKPPMPCAAVRSGVKPFVTGYCPRSESRAASTRPKSG
jgi:hypothetical protein